MGPRPWLSDKQQARHNAIDSRDLDVEEVERGVPVRPCTVCKQPCRDVGPQPKCADCGPTDPRRWKR